MVWTYAGVRPLLDDGSGKPEEATRDYVLELDTNGGAPVVSVFGGKITTARRLAESVIDKLKGLSPIARVPGWSGGAVLPGGDFPVQGFDRMAADLCVDYPWADRAMVFRLARAYGVRARRILTGCSRMEDLGQILGANLTAREVDYLRREEWAETADDILWRRSKLGLRFSADQRAALETYLTQTAGYV